VHEDPGAGEREEDARGDPRQCTTASRWALPPMANVGMDVPGEMTVASQGHETETYPSR